MSADLYLSRADVEAVALPMRAFIDALDAMFRDKGEGRVEMPPKPGIHTQPDAFIHAMPAWIPGLGAAGVKWVSGYPGNQAKGLPYITGLLILNDPETGVPTAVMDATWITAQRTGAATAVAARYLARPDSASAGILACLLAAAFARDMAAVVDGDIEVVDTPREADADLGEIVAGKKPGRQSDDERAICINLGIALDDMATAIRVLDGARAAGLGTELPL